MRRKRKFRGSEVNSKNIREKEKTEDNIEKRKRKTRRRAKRMKYSEIRHKMGALKKERKECFKERWSKVGWNQR
jgi:hypothetical protein